MMFLRSLSLLALLFGLVACSGDPANQSEAPSDTATETEAEAEAAAELPTITVAALSNPAAWLVERLGGDRVTVNQVLPAGEDPRFWRPPAEVIVELQNADLIVMNGAGYEAWTGQANLPLSRLIESAADLDLIETVGRTHSHGDGGEHSHAGLDPHTWLDPDLYLEQARRVDEALRQQGVETDGLAALESDLTALAGDLETVLGPLENRALAANHPSFAYFARRFGLAIETIDLDPQGPGAEHVAALESWVAGVGEGEAILFWIEEPAESVKTDLGEGVLHVVLDPLEQPAAGRYDYLEQMRGNVLRLEQLLRRLAPAVV